MCLIMRAHIDVSQVVVQNFLKESTASMHDERGSTEEMRTESVDVGKFEITSGKMRVTDPCYERDAWASDVLAVAAGTWRATIERCLDQWQNPVASLTVEYVGGTQSTPDVWVFQKFTVGVDSAQVVFIDDTL